MQIRFGSVKYNPVLWAIFALLLNAERCFAICPDWVKAQSSLGPTCPQSSLLPETFPVAAIVVSDTRSDGQRDQELPSQVVQRVLLGAGTQLPLILLPVADATLTKIRTDLNALPISEELKKSFLQVLVQVPHNKGFPWQQDYFLSTQNLSTGLPVLRPIAQYTNVFNVLAAVGQLQNSISECGVTTGPPLGRSRAARPSTGVDGGNIEALPGGICAVGMANFTNIADWSTYVDQFCAKESQNRILVPTSWLNVGHTDEVLKLIRNHGSGVQAPCDFSLVVASPDKALELLKANSKDLFLDFAGNIPVANERVKKYRGLRLLCEAVKQLQPTSAGTQQKIKLHAATLHPKRSVADQNAETPVPDECLQITNGDVAEVLRTNANFGDYNHLVQLQMNALKTELAAKLGAKFPQCQIDFVDAPDLFFGAPLTRMPTGVGLPPTQGLSILPNPSNSMTVNDTVISPEPGNSSFKTYLKAQYESRKLNAEFVDTFDYAHVFEGNLHCATHTLHVCSPQAPSH